jgi:predicted TPR repeat methyltransferase
MDIKQAYNLWAEQYDSNVNKTRDLEALSLREILCHVRFERCLEIGCGTGKNTEYLSSRAAKLTSVDLSDEMLKKARLKFKAENVEFIRADINEDWTFINGKYELVTFSLILEHIENLENIFCKVEKVTLSGSHVYIGELHPYKQYSGSKARFETEHGQQTVTCFTHNISDFTSAAAKYGFEILALREYFDDNNKASVPRILTLLLKKK